MFVKILKHVFLPDDWKLLAKPLYGSTKAFKQQGFCGLREATIQSFRCQPPHVKLQILPKIQSAAQFSDRFRPFLLDSRPNLSGGDTGRSSTEVPSSTTTVMGYNRLRPWADGRLPEIFKIILKSLLMTWIQLRLPVWRLPL